MGGGQHRRHREPDRDQAVVFFRNAEGFLHAADIAKAGFPGHALHFLAIAIELALKAYLLNQGIRDDWNRVHIGHDLSKALECAQRAGFDGAPSGLAALAALLTPLYMRTAVWQAPPEMVASESRANACKIVRGLVGSVSTALGLDLPEGKLPPWPWLR